MLQHVPNKAQQGRQVNDNARPVARGNQDNIVWPPLGDVLPIVYAIFNGDKPEHMQSQRCAYCKEAYHDSIGM